MKLPIETIERIANAHGIPRESSFMGVPLGIVTFTRGGFELAINAAIKEVQDSNEAVAEYRETRHKEITPHQNEITCVEGKVVRNDNFLKIVSNGTKLYPFPPNNSEVDELKALLKVANCPECDGGGVVQTPDEIHQCRWCHEKESALATIGDK